MVVVGWAHDLFCAGVRMYVRPHPYRGTGCDGDGYMNFSVDAMTRCDGGGIRMYVWPHLPEDRWEAHICVVSVRRYGPFLAGDGDAWHDGVVGST